MTKALVAMRIRAIKAVEAREAGQGTLEYVGMIFAVAVVVAAVVTVLKTQDLGARVTTAFTSVFGG